MERKSYEELFRIYQTFLLPLEQRITAGLKSSQSGQKLFFHRNGFEKISAGQPMSTTAKLYTESSQRAKARSNGHEERASAPDSLIRPLVFQPNARFTSEQNSVPLKRHRSGYESFHSVIERINGSNTENVKRLKILWSVDWIKTNWDFEEISLFSSGKETGLTNVACFLAK